MTTAKAMMTSRRALEEEQGTVASEPWELSHRKEDGKDESDIVSTFWKLESTPRAMSRELFG